MLILCEFLRIDKGFLAGLPWLRDKELALFINKNRNSMKKFYYLSIATILFIGCTKVSTPNSLMTEGLRGHVKLQTTKCYEASMRFGELQKGDLMSDSDMDSWLMLYPTSVSEYNEEGNLVKLTTYKKNGEIWEMFKYEYINNHCISMSLYTLDGELSYSWKTIIEDGKPVRQEIYSRTSQPNDETIEYEYNGLDLKKELHYKNGELTETRENVVVDGLLRQVRTTDKDGNVTFQLTQEWTNNAQLAFRHYVSEGEDALIEKTIYNDKQLPLEYSRTGKWSNGEISCSFEYSSFDNKGNWLTRIIKVDNTPVGIQERIIEYY